MSAFPHLLKLLDDPSEVVQQEVRKALLPMAPDIANLLKIFPAEAGHRQALTRLLYGWRKAQLLKGWQSWSQRPPEQQLEGFHTLLCEFHDRWNDPIPLAERLQALADELSGASLEELPARLFPAKLRGNREDYFHPDNSLLTQVLRQGKGNPISLCTILMLVGQRLGLSYQGCPFPAHFLATFAGPDGLRAVDAFAGVCLKPELTEDLRGDLGRAATIQMVGRVAEPLEMAARVLRNLVGAHLRREESAPAALYDLLLKDVVARGQGRGEGLALREPLFWPGQVVRHRHKDYRGVVVDYELYAAHDGPPHLPLYRILVHGSPQVATAHEELLRGDEGGRVAHALIGMFFKRFENGHYVRNDQPWTGS